ncbi:hypothetical protein CPB84DRAFT_1821617 [Gymnopilus junonius]|uniref:F-box domain-containing protein n=1 Tax=Gymnopilus junonius TaxID=109634 RepID=A0A9P5TT67_GYMJU|nr:hypothetical protein CPB84DRAFT_1821617 [Gymnopilus junonius]
MYRCNFCSSIDTISLHPDETYATCQDELCSTCRRFQTLNEQIWQLQSSLTDLVNERRNLKPQLNNVHQSIIHRLPVEISTTIFFYYVHDSSKLERPTIRSWVQRLDSPLVLGAVCQAWRHIAWSFPNLWTSLKMELGSPVRATKIQIAIEWLCRSESLPLTIKLFSHKVLEKLDAEPYFSFIAFINQQSYRWYSLTLDLPGVLLSRFHDSQGTTGMLHKLDINLSSSSPSELCISRAAPRLVSIRNVELDNTRFKWKNITYFSSTHFRLDEVLAVLRRAPQLMSAEFLAVKRRPNRNSTNEHQSPSIYPLKSLVIGFDQSSIGSFFDNVTLPSLTNFTFYLASKRTPVETLASFLERSGCHLEKFSLQEVKINNEDLIRITRLLPSLSYLSLGIECFSNATTDVTEQPLALGSFYSALAAHSLVTVDSLPSFAGPLLPKLKTVKIFGNFLFKAELSGLLRGLFAPSSNRESTALRPLEFIQICFERSPEDIIPFINQTTLDYILDLSRKGVKFDLKVQLENNSKLGDLLQLSLQKFDQAGVI